MRDIKFLVTFFALVSCARQVMRAFETAEHVDTRVSFEASSALSMLLLAQTTGAYGTFARPNAKQSLSQNFLCDDGAAKAIVDALGARSNSTVGDGGNRVIEMGPGQGALTTWLVHAYPKMTAVEIDKRMIEVLSRTHPALKVTNMDMLQLDMRELAVEKGGKLFLISNTPFHLTSKILFKICGALEDIEEVVLTMQLEVAEKILAPHNCKDYGIISVMLQLFGRPNHLFTIPPTAFSPAPKCSVAVVRLEPSAVPVGTATALSKKKRERLLALLKRTFENRRKMLRVTLKSLLKQGVETRPPDELLSKRPEQLAPHEFLDLADMLFGEGEDEAEGSDSAINKISSSHVSDSWKPLKAGWGKSKDHMAFQSYQANAAGAREAKKSDDA